MRIEQLEAMIGKPTFTTGLMIPTEGAEGRYRFDLSEPRFGDGHAAYWACMLEPGHRIDPLQDTDKYCAALTESGSDDWTMFRVCSKHRSRFTGDAG